MSLARLVVAIRPAIIGATEVSVELALMIGAGGFPIQFIWPKLAPNDFDVRTGP
jgi:hypothetical protein